MPGRQLLLSGRASTHVRWAWALPSHVTPTPVQLRARTVDLSQLAGRLQRGKVDRLEDLLVQLLRLRAVEGHAQQDERVCEALCARPRRVI